MSFFSASILRTSFLVPVCFFMLLSNNVGAQKLKSITSFSWSGTWDLSDFTRYVYKTNGADDSLLTYRRINGNWQPNYLYVDSPVNNASLQTTGFLWNLTSTSWTLASRIIVTYTTGNKILQAIALEYDGTNFVDKFKYDYTYDQNMFQLSQEIFQMDTTWKPMSKYVYSNNSTGTSTMTLLQGWNQATASWKDTHRTITTFAGQMQILYFDGWNGSAWVPSSSSTYSYNSSGQLVYHDSKMYQGNNYVNSWQGTSVFAAGGYTETIQSWLSSTSTWTNTTKFIYEYDPTSLTISEFERPSFNLFPSPVREELVIKDLQNTSCLFVCDALGKIIDYRQVSAPTEKLDVSALPAGIYFIRDEMGNSVKFVKTD